MPCSDRRRPRLATIRSRSRRLAEQSWKLLLGASTQIHRRLDSLTTPTPTSAPP